MFVIRERLYAHPVYRKILKEKQQNYSSFKLQQVGENSIVKLVLEMYLRITAEGN